MCVRWSNIGPPPAKESHVSGFRARSEIFGLQRRYLRISDIPPDKALENCRLDYVGFVMHSLWRTRPMVFVSQKCRGCHVYYCIRSVEPLAQR